MAVISQTAYTDLISRTAPATCIAVSKHQSIADIKQLYGYGHRHFAENYLQELLAKQASLDLPEIIWHFTGRIQSRKCRLLANSVSWVHAINSDTQLALLNKHRRADLPKLNCLIQVIPEQYPHGYALPMSLAQNIIAKNYPHITIPGIMCMPAAESTPEQARAIFRAAEIFAKANWQHPEISMGMSADYKAAIAAGATMLRLGRAFFVSR